MLLAAGDAAHDMLMTMAVAVAAGVFLIVAARRLAIPGIVLLLAGGVLLGPSGLGFVRPDGLGEGLRVVVALAIGLILFEGGLTLDREGYRSAPSMIGRLLTLGVAITWLGTALAIHLVAGLPLTLSIIAGSLVIVTGPTVIAPLLKRIRIEPRVHAILHWESVLIDPIGVFIAVLCFEWIGEQEGGAAVFNLLVRLAAGLGIGVAGGGLLTWVVTKRLVPSDMVNLFALAVAVLVFGLAEMVQSEAGLLSVTAAGFVFGLSGAAQLREVRRFKAELTDLLIGTLFILLAARLELEQFREFGLTGAAVVAVVMFAVRPLSIFACGAGVGLSTREKVLLSGRAAPRGIVAASIASLFAIRLAEVGTVTNPRFVETFTYSVIVATVVIQGLTAGPLARRLGLARPEATGWLVVGAHALGRRFASFIRETAGQSVVLVDTNRRAISEARREQITAVRADARDPALLDRFGLTDVGRVLALTDNEDLNVRVCEAWARVPGIGAVYRCDTGDTDATAQEPPPVWRGLPRPTVLSAEIEAGEADFDVLPAADADAGPAGRVLAEFAGGRITLDPEASAAAEDAVRCVVRRSSDHLLRALHPRLLVTVEADDAEALFRSMVDALVALRADLPRDRLVQDLVARERMMPSAIGHGVAIPHAYVSGLDTRLCALARVPAGLDLGGPDGEPARLVFLLVSPKGDPEGHLGVLAEIARLVRWPRTRTALLEAGSAREVLRIVREAQ